MEAKYSGVDTQLPPAQQGPNQPCQQPSSQPSKPPTMPPYQQPPIQPSQPQIHPQVLIQPAPAPPPGQPGQQQADWKTFNQMRGMHVTSMIMTMVGGFLCFIGIGLTASGFSTLGPTGMRIMGPILLCTGLALVVTAIAMCILLRKEMHEKQISAISQQPVVVGMAPSGQPVSYQPPAPCSAYSSSQPIALEPVYPTAPQQSGMRQADLVAPPTYDEATCQEEENMKSELK